MENICGQNTGRGVQGASGKLIQASPFCFSEAGFFYSIGKPSGRDAHAAMRYVTALRYCGGAQSVQASQDSGEGGAGLTYILYFARMSSEVLQ